MAFDAIKNALIKRVIEGWLKKNKENPMLKFLQGKKTYLVMIATIIIGGIDTANQAGVIHFTIPAIAYTVLGALGIYTRAVAKP